MKVKVKVKGQRSRSCDLFKVIYSSVPSQAALPILTYEVIVKVTLCQGQGHRSRSKAMGQVKTLMPCPMEAILAVILYIRGICYFVTS